MCKNKYRKKNRLNEIIALIQVLSIDEDGHRSETGLQQELQTKPISAKDWTTVCQEHPEFFRVNSTEKNPISLISRHASPNKKIEVDFVKKLIEIAIQLHDKAEERAKKHFHYIPVYIAILTSLVAIFLTFYGPGKDGEVIINNYIDSIKK